MSTFVLPHHADSGTLHKMLHEFRHRIASKPDSPQLADMFNALQQKTGTNANSHHFMIYWPLKKEAFETKRCLYEASISAITTTPKPFHFIYITSLLSKLERKKHRFRPCKCVDHVKPVRLDWREFVYPQFVELLFKRSMTPSQCPSPVGPRTIQFVNESLQCCFEIEKQVSFLTDVQEELFRLPCSELYERHGNSHLTVFGSENVETERHFFSRCVTTSDYKLDFQVSETKMRVFHMKGGGRLMLRKTAEPYVIIASNFHFLPSSKDGASHYNVYTQTGDNAHSNYQLSVHKDKRIKSSKFCPDHTPCMIVSTSPLILEFKEGAQGSFILYTPGECRVQIFEQAQLELWNKDPAKYGWPLCYEVNDEIMKCDYPGNEARYFEKLHARYHNLFDCPVYDRFHMCAPAHGYVYMHVEDEIVLGANGQACIRTIYRDQEQPLNQYASMQASPPHDEFVSRSSWRSLVASIRSYVKNDKFHFHIDNEALILTEVSYHLGGGGGGNARSKSASTATAGPIYFINALRRPADTSPFVYYYMNHEKTFILFIPVY